MTRVQRQSILFVGACALCALVLWLPPLAGTRARVVGTLLAPTRWISQGGGSLRNLFSTAVPPSLEALTEERNALVRENARLRSLEQENQELRELMDVRERARLTFVTAQVIGKSPEVDTHALIIDQGHDAGVAVGMPVIASGGFLLGKVARTTAHTAVVLLVTDSRSRVAAGVLNNDRTIGFVEGGRGLGMLFRLIPQYEKVESGQLVISSGLEENIPRGLIIGRVERISREPQEPFQTATISQIIPAEQNHMVAVIRTEESL